MICEGFAYPKVMQFFEEISAIPRASHHEEKISDYLECFAKERGLEYLRDEVGNLLIRRPASAGYENRAPMLLQGHVDMVCEKNEGVVHDFDKDPLKLYVKDGWLRAKGTTLGADNGVAVAIMMAMLDGMAEEHPALECLFTVSEEVGLDGARAFDYSNISARRMLNMDSADERSIIVGCAGGVRSSIRMTVMRASANVGETVVLRIGGLCGGHSGEDIDKGRVNAAKVMGRVLMELLQEEPELRLISLQSGTKDNAIPREAEAVILVPCVATVLTRVKKLEEIIRKELCAEDRNFTLTACETKCHDRAMDKDSTRRALNLLHAVVSGVLKNYNVKAVLYSRNLGVVTTDEDVIEFVYSSRSPDDSLLDHSIAELDGFASILMANAKHYNRYPGWEYSEESKLREDYIAAYRRLFGDEPRIQLIHAGLECGLIKQAIPDMDMLSCGPNIVNLHSPEEAMEIASFERFVQLVIEVLKA